MLGDKVGAMGEEEAAAALGALGKPVRLRLYRLLVRAGPPGLTVGDVQRRLEIPASTLAHHLSALVQAGMVRQSRQGREVICTAAFDTMNRLIDYLTSECCADLHTESEMAAVR